MIIPVEMIKSISQKIIPAHTFLSDASAALKDRAAQRDALEGERSMARTVALFNSFKGKELLSETDGWLFMVFLKLIRGDQGEFRSDDYVDAAGYVALAGEAKSEYFTKNLKFSPELSVEK